MARPPLTRTQRPIRRPEPTPTLTAIRDQVLALAGARRI